MSIGDRILELRTRHGLTQAELGAVAGVTDKAVSSWEKGIRAPRMGAIQKMADYFHIPKSQIIEDDAALVNGDPELTEYLEELKNRSELRALFALTKNASKEDVERAIKIVEALRK